MRHPNLQKSLHRWSSQHRPQLPLCNWCRLLQQAKLTLNLLRPSRLNPKLSAYAQLEGAFDFNRTPLAPPGTRVIAHEKPNQRRTWAPHGIDGWYIGPALDHYQCYRVWIPSTHAERIADTIQFFPTILRTPTLSHRDATLQAARELTHALQNLNNANPLSQLSDDQLRALHQLSTFFPTDAPGVETQPVATPDKPQFPAPHKPAPYKLRPRPPESSPATPPSPRPAIQPRYNLRPRVSYAAPVTHADTGRSMEYRDLLADPTTRDVWFHSVDWTGKRFCGIHLHWDYLNRTCDLSMPGYVDHALHKFQHPTPKKPQDSPYPAAVKQYGVQVQLTDTIDTSARLPPNEIKRLQQIIGTFLFYGRAVDPTLLTALSELSSAQATALDATKRACQQFLDYCASHPDGAIRYQASDMILKLHSDSSYLNAVGARSRQGGHLYLGNKSEPDILNGAVLNLAAIMKMVLSSAAEAEFGALFHNTKEATPLRTTLAELGHPQPPTPILVDNSTVVVLSNDTVTQRRSRALDMRFYWVLGRVNQQQYHVYWAPAHHNLADYFTKHHTPSHHRKMRKYFVYTTASPKFLPTAPT